MSVGPVVQNISKRIQRFDGPAIGQRILNLAPQPRVRHQPGGAQNAQVAGNRGLGRL